MLFTTANYVCYMLEFICVFDIFIIITISITIILSPSRHDVLATCMCVAPITQWANQVWGPDSAGNGIDILCLIWHCSCQCGLIAILYWSQWFFLIAQLSCIVLLWAHNSSFVGRLCLRQLHNIYFSLSLAVRDLAGIQLSRLSLSWVCAYTHTHRRIGYTVQ